MINPSHPAMRPLRPIIAVLILSLMLAAPALMAKPTVRGPDKPANLEDAAWHNLQKAIRAATQEARLFGEVSSPGADGATEDYFGWSVALSGDTAMVGAPKDNVGVGDDHGSVYVFTRSGTAWALQSKLVAPNRDEDDLFGVSVALSGDTALVGAIGARGAELGTGAAHVFTRSGSNWIWQAKLLASDGRVGDQFGISVALSGDTALVGANRDHIGSNFDQGSAYVFTRNGAIWTEQAKLVASDGTIENDFGVSVTLSGDIALVGSPGSTVGGIGDQGAVYVFARSGTNWIEQTRLVAADGTWNDHFGVSVALADDTALIGAYLDSHGAGSSQQGSAYVFTRQGANWTQQAKLVALDAATGDRLGRSVALVGDTALTGANWTDVGDNVTQGAAYVFTRSGTTWTQQAKLLASNGVASDYFGWSVALSADTALVGAVEDNVGANFNQGSANVFSRSGTNWAQQAHLTSGAGASSNVFGYSVALSSNTALVGVPADDIGENANQGSAYVFTRNGPDWIPQAQLVAADGSANDEFGASVAISGDTALVGALQDDIGANINQGSVYLFRRNGTTWTQVAKWIATDGAPGDQFGGAVALSGNLALVSASADSLGTSNQQGSAYVFARDGSAWAQQAKLVAADGFAYARFGSSVSLSGDTALVGAKIVNSAYVFTRTGTVWSQQAKLQASDSAQHDLFGNAVAVSGDTALIAANGDDIGANIDQGSVYVFTRSGMNWTQQNKLTASDGAGGDAFGTSIALSGDTALVGADRDDTVSHLGNGSAYVFTRDGITWIEQEKLIPGNDGPAFRVFANALALSNGRALVGAQLSSVATGPYGNADEGSAYVFASIGPEATSDLEISIFDGTSYAVPGGFSEYELLIANTGPQPVHDARLLHAIPTGLGSALWTCTTVQGVNCPVASGSGGLDELVDLPVNGVLRFLVSAAVTASAGESITSTATIATPDGVIEMEQSDNVATDVNSVVADGLFDNGFEPANRSISVPIPLD